MSAGVLKSGTDYWFYIEVKGGFTWRLLLEDLSNHPINALTESHIYQGGTLVKSLSTTGSVWEYAWSHTDYPSIGQFGNAHGHDTQSSITFEIDGQAVTPGATLQSGNELVATRVSDIDDGGDPSTVIGTVTVTYTLTNKLVLTIQADWVNTPTEAPGGLTGMWPFTEDLDRGFILTYDAVAWKLDTATVSNLRTPIVASKKTVVWENGGGWGQLHSRDELLNVYIQDRPNLGKIYPSDIPAVGAGNVQNYTSVSYQVAQVGDYISEYNLLELETE